MSDSPRYLKSLASHFVLRDWQYTRLHTIKHIRYEDDYKGRNAPWRRVAPAFKAAWESLTATGLFGEFIQGRSMRRRLLGAYYALKVGMATESHNPDGVLLNAGIITQWEEDGEYLQMVQPSVGRLLADFLIDRPEHPHAVLITAELDRIRADYTARIKAGEVDGSPHEHR